MPALTLTPDDSNSLKVLVTGANGFLATWIVGDLLRRGYLVRAAVRTEDKGNHLLEIYSSFAGRLEIVAVGDMVREGAYDNAVQGVDGVIHTATQVTTDLDGVDPQDLIRPSVNGAVGILTSITKYGHSVKRVIYTSSCTTVASDAQPAPITVSERNYRTEPVRECEEKGKHASGVSKYRASKILAEKGVWDFYETHKMQIKWDLTVLNPPWIFGPAIHKAPTYAQLNASNKAWYSAILKLEGASLGASPLTYPAFGWIDVRDASLMHLLALEVPTAGGERIIISAGEFVWQDWVDIANSLNPCPYPYPLPTGDTSGERVCNIKFDTSKAQSIFGIKYRTMEEVTHDLLVSFVRHGWVIS